MHQAIWKKILAELSEITILLQCSACPDTENLMKVVLATVEWKIMNHPPYCPYLAPSDIHFFIPMKGALRKTGVSN
jgi:hypothetical protein